MSAVFETPRNAWQCVYPGTPRPQARARAVVRGARAGVAPDVRSMARQLELKSFLVDRWQSEPLEGPVSLYVSFDFAVPQSWPKWRRDGALTGLKGLQCHMAKPDVDNLVKMLKDAASGVLWRDDSQVHVVHAIKRWSEVASTRLELQWLSPVPRTKAEL